MLTEARSGMAVKPEIAVTINGTDESKVQLLPTTVEYETLPLPSPGGSSNGMRSQGQSCFDCKHAV